MLAAPINQIKEGYKVIIKGINLEPSLKKKLLEMGIAPKTKLKVVNKQKSGYMIIATENFKLALNDHIASHIIVEPIN